MTKEYVITGADRTETKKNHAAAKTIALFTGDDQMQVSDGFHTMDELYTHRICLYITLCKALTFTTSSAAYPVWRSKFHADGSAYDGWFILGIRKEKGKQISYHLPLARWESTDFAETLDKAPEWDGHGSGDVLIRLHELI